MLRRAVGLGPQGVLREVKDAKLLGRGGAAFPTAIKWEAVAANPVQPHYVICNADESEPGTFKDRVLMESDPYALIEALTVMGYACEAAHGFIYIRGEYPLAEARLRHAVAQARAHGFLGARRDGQGLRLRHRGQARRRRVHRRRGDRADQLAGRQARRAAEQAAVPRAVRPVRQADRGQQRGDAAVGAGDPARRRSRLRGNRDVELDWDPVVLPVRVRGTVPGFTSTTSASRWAR